MNKKNDCDPSHCETCGESDCPSAAKPTQPTQPTADEKAQDDDRKLEVRMSRIEHKIVVLSGKGGVGKSTIAVNLATSLKMAGKRVGLLDVDIHGPSIPTMLGLEQEHVQNGEDGIMPVDADGIKVMSLGFLLRDMDDAVIWRGPMKMGVVRQFLADVDWGALDYLVIDVPPGTGDELLSICQLLAPVDGAIVVTTPQRVAAVDVRKSVTFCRQMKVPVIGVVENMSGFACPKCGEVTQVFRSGAGKMISDSMDVPFLGAIHLEPQVVEAGDGGRAFLEHYADSATAAAMRTVVAPALQLKK